MYLIVGLGNPDKQYLNTYHNIGFLTVDKICEKLGAKFSKSMCKANVAETFIGNQKVFLAKPTTYMNLSGESVLAFKSKFKLKNTQIVVIVDDIDLNKGTFRYRQAGSPGTHNGMRSIVSTIGSDFKRVRIGIKPEEKPYDLASYVLSKIDDQSLAVLEEVIESSADFIIDQIKNERTEA